MSRDDMRTKRGRGRATTASSRPTRRSSLSDSSLDAARGEKSGRKGVRSVIIVLIVIASLLAAVLVGGIVLAHTPVFTITAIDAPATEHLSSDDIAKLAAVEEGTTLINVDEATVCDNIKRNPWVKNVTLSRELPDILRIEVHERKVDCIVAMSSGRVCWCLGDDYVWIEPINLTVGAGQAVEDVALRTARDMGALLVTDVPSSVSPRAGSETTDEVLLAVQQYREQFTNKLLDQIVCFSAQSVDSLACTLESGVEISLGAPSNIDTKESVIETILSKHPNQITYINVRMPAQATYRMIGTESVDAGTGIQIDESTSQETETTDTAETTSEEATSEETTDGQGVEGESTDGTTDGDGSTDDTSSYDDGTYSDGSYDSYGYDESSAYDESYGEYYDESYGYDESSY